MIHSEKSPSAAIVRLRIWAVVVAVIGLSLPLGAIDRVRIESNVDAAVARYGVTGKGVLIAILDRGIDWQNHDFRNPDGTTRLAAIYDLTDDSGASAPGNPYGRGTLYSRSQIDFALQSGTGLATRDAVGHGTTTAGIAAGNGRNSPGGKYRGIAPEATLLVVKITSDGAPAHDDQPAEAPFWDPSRVPLAIDFVRAQAASLRMPCVMLLNLGSQGGPTDGTSSLARKIDSVVGPGIPGLVFVTGTGDEGGMPNRAGGTVAAGGAAAIQIQKGAPGTLRFDLWYPGSDRFDVSITTPSSVSVFTSPATNTQWDTRTSPEFTYWHLGSETDVYEAQNGKREILIDLKGPVGTYTVTLHGASVATGRFDATLNPSFFWSSPSNLNRFLTFIAPGSIWDGATGQHNIVPTSYVIRTTWTSITGRTNTLAGEGNPGEIWRGSSTGPTFDGRIGVDVAAPGDRIVTTYGPKSYWATFRENLINDGLGLYGMAGAVSAANPIVTGAIALMLQKNPRLDAPSVKRLLQQSARADSFTGAIPNATWGFGKLDVLAALDAVPPVVPTAADFNGDRKSDAVVFRPSDGVWYFRYSGTSVTGSVAWGTSGDVPVPGDYDGDGVLDVAVFRPAEGVWYVRYATGTASAFRWGAPIDVPVPGDYNGDGRTDLAVYRPSEGTWYFWYSGTSSTSAFRWGLPVDLPAPGDFDGDGRMDIAVYRPVEGTWYIRYSRDGSIASVRWGTTGDVPVSADYDGDGKSDVAVFRPSEGIWYFRYSSTGATGAFRWGIAGDVPTPGDFDGDGKTDIAVFRPSEGTWYLWYSSTGLFDSVRWGGTNDVPILMGSR